MTGVAWDVEAIEDPRLYLEPLRPLATGEHVVRVGYVTEAGPLTWEQFGRHIAMTDEEERAAIAARLHARWPQYYDERGRRYP